ncbi:MAG TPA: hypothetical protein ENJ84_15370 [Gammaproteobacteria bacterium]|nr:hypothetical protein [Gammaproteobacteria bacterium]
MNWCRRRFNSAEQGSFAFPAVACCREIGTSGGLRDGQPWWVYCSAVPKLENSEIPGKFKLEKIIAAQVKLLLGTINMLKNL